MSIKKRWFRIAYGLVLTISTLLVLGLVVVLQMKVFLYEESAQPLLHTETLDPFPVSVDPSNKTIVEHTLETEARLEAIVDDPGSESRLWSRLAYALSSEEWFQNMASPVTRIVTIWPGQRKEEVVKHVGDIMRWSTDDRARFITLVDQTYPILSEGKYFPGRYIIHRHTTPEEFHTLLYGVFRSEVVERYAPEVAAQIPLHEALTIASLIEREASDFENMRQVSGVIWNRLFQNMPLQLDATLQYAKGSRPTTPSWWPPVRPDDKFIRSAYNTYQEEGLPPAPIANPSVAAIVAALNPYATDCLFYFHTGSGTYHCSQTYEEHVAKLRSLYGRGS